MTIPIQNTDFKRQAKPKTERRGYIRTRSEEFTISKPDGSGVIGPTRRDFVVSRNCVAGIPYCPSQKKVLLARQFRMPVMHDTGKADKSWIYESIAGVIDDGEESRDCFIREAKEEAGVDCDINRLSLIASVYLSPGISTEKMFIFKCEMDDCVPETPKGGLDSECEAIEAAWLTYDQARELREKGHIEDAKTLIALLSMGL